MVHIQINMYLHSNQFPLLQCEWKNKLVKKKVASSAGSLTTVYLVDFIVCMGLELLRIIITEQEIIQIS